MTVYGITQLLQPASLEEALQALSGPQPPRPLAGGTDLLVELRRDQEQDVHLLSLDRLPQLRRISLQEQSVCIGPACTFTQIAQDPLIAGRLPLLKTAALAMGGPQIQNVATIGGNVCTGATSGESAAPLLALDAVYVLRSAQGERQIAAEEFYTGPGRTCRRPEELLTEIRIPAPPLSGWGSAYIKFSVRKAMDIATLTAAAVCAVDGAGAISRCAIALGVAAPTPIRCHEAEALLTGKVPDAALLAQAGELALLPSKPRSSWRASAEYRQALIRELSMRALQQAYQQAQGGENQ